VDIIGTCQLIPPQQEDYEGAANTVRPRSKRRKIETSNETDATKSQPDSRKHWIACLFTSVGYGKPTKKHPGMDKPDVILGNTEKSLVDLKEQLLKLENKSEEGDDDESPKTRTSVHAGKPGELWSCKFNNGLFAVDWADTRKVLEEELKSLGKPVRVVSPGKS
jgi:ADP-ribose 1''-phosphate phosphatase